MLVPAYDNFRWYDEKTNTNNQFLMFLFFMLYHFFAIWKFLKLGNLVGDFLGVNFRSRDLLGVLGIFWGFDLCPL